MRLVTTRGQTYNLAHLVRYLTRIGTREVGATEHVRAEAEPVFGEFRYLELFFSDGSRVELDGIQSSALLRYLKRHAHVLDLDQIDEDVLGHVLVHDTEAGDVILPSSAEIASDAEARRHVPLPTDPDLSDLPATSGDAEGPS